MNKEQFNDIYYSMGCGCGNPEGVKFFLYQLMAAYKEYWDNKISYDEWVIKRHRIIIETDPSLIFEFVFHVLEHQGIVEHGSSVHGSWFTDLGEEFLEELENSLKDES